MKALISILFVVTITSALAQGRSASKADSVLSSLDTLKLPVLQAKKVDSIQQKLKTKADSMASFKGRAQSKLDSIKSIKTIQRQKQKLDSARVSVSSSLQRLDSLNPTDKIDRYNLKLDSVRQKLQSRIDSLSHLKLDAGMIKGLDSLRMRLDSLKSSGPIKDIKQAEAKLAELQKKVGTRVSNVENKINEKLDLFSKQGLNTPQLNLPGSSLALPALDLSNTGLPDSKGIQLGAGLKLPDANLPSANLPHNMNLPKWNGNEAGDKATIKDQPELKTGGITQHEEVKKIKTDFAKVGELGNEVKGYQKDLQKIKEGDWEVEHLQEKAEEKALELAGDELQQHTAMVEKWKSNPAYAKELVLNQAKEQAVNHFAGHEEELKVAMEQLSKLKAKKKFSEGVIDLFNKRQKSLGDKPFVECLVPGISLQIQAGPHVWLDSNPYVGYRVSARFTAGAGWNERVSFDYKARFFDKTERIYGPRLYTEFKLKDFMFIKAETEWMNAKVLTPRQKYLNETPRREWVWSNFAGIKNVFNLSPTMRGNVQILYNLYNPDKKSPYADRLNVRFGFEYVIKKKADGLQKK